jgi:signal transduction histidine kinase
MAGYSTPAGELLFGDATGYYAFFPDQLTTNTKAPKVILTDFKIAELPVKPGNNSPLNVPVEEAKEIKLNYKENVFSFDFAGIHYSSPEENRHLFMLDRYEKNWRKAGSEKAAYYFNVPPGEYVFRVKASSSDGIWAEKAVKVIISPPWWRTWWAYSFYGLCFLAALFAFDRFQRRRLIQGERERTRERELAQAREIEKAYHELKSTQAQLIQSEKMASLGELTAGIAHEIQNPLNFVNNFSEVNKELIEELKSEKSKIKSERDEQLEEELLNNIAQNLDKINHHGKRADAIVKGMLQHSQTSTGQKEPTDINALVDEYLRLSYHGFRAKDKSFNAIMQTDFDESIGKINIIPQDIGRVLLNLYNNAFYAVTEKKMQQPEGYNPTVSVNTKRINDKVEIRVKDNGNGVLQKVLDKIFQPFFTTKPTGQGTGLGLSLSYDIVKAHGGELKVETKEGEGSEFVISLPLK